MSLSFFWVFPWEPRPFSPHHSRPWVSSKDSFPPSSCLCSDRLTSSSTELRSFENSSSPVPPRHFCATSALLSPRAAHDSDLHHAHLSPCLLPAPPASARTAITSHCRQHRTVLLLLTSISLPSSPSFLPQPLSTLPLVTPCHP